MSSRLHNVNVLSSDLLPTPEATLGAGVRVRGRRLAIVSNAGGPGTIAADRAQDRGLQIARLGAESLRRLAEELPPAAREGNPVYVRPDVDRTQFGAAMRICLEDPAASCAQHFECETGEFCRDGACRRSPGACASDKDCPVGACTHDLLITATAADVDADNLADPIDNCPSVKNENQADLDGDEVGDACDRRSACRASGPDAARGGIGRA